MRHIRIIGLAVIIIGSGAGAETPPLTPLLDAMNAGADKPYVFARCAALYGAALEVAEMTTGPISEADSAKFIDEIGFHLAMSHLHSGYDANELPDVNENVMTLTSDIQNRYEALLRENYVSSGNVLAGFADQDRQVCAALKEASVD